MTYEVLEARSITYPAVSDLPNTNTQASIESVPPPAQWTPEWRERFRSLDLNSHFNYLSSFHRAVSSLSSRCGGLYPLVPGL